MSEKFLIARVGLEMDGAWTHVCGLWHIAPTLSHDEGVALGELVAALCQEWIQRRVGNRKGMFRCYAEPISVEYYGKIAIDALADCLLSPPDSLERFLSAEPPPSFDLEGRYRG